MPIAVLQIRDVYLGFRILIFTHPGTPAPGSRIPDPGSKTSNKTGGVKKIFVAIHFFVATNFTKF
jgi:hypothetical protein